MTPARLGRVAAHAALLAALLCAGGLGLLGVMRRLGEVAARVVHVADQRAPKRDLAPDEPAQRLQVLGLTEIAYLLGFQETATFSRAFKHWTGLAPSRFPAT